MIFTDLCSLHPATPIKMQLRICFTSAPKVLYGKDINANGYARELHGRGSEVMKALLGYEYLSHRRNVSLLFYPSRSEGMDRAGTGMYDGCIGALQQGKADVAASFFPFPVMTPNLTQGPALAQYESWFITSYKPSATHVAPDLLEFFSGISIVSSAAFITACISIAILIWLSHWRSCARPIRRAIYRTGRRSNQSLYLVCWTLVSYMLGNFHSNRRFKRTRMLFSLLIFLAFMYRIQTNLVMKTEQVIATPAIKLRTMEQLFDRKITFAWVAEIEYNIFKRSTITDMKRMFDASMRKGLDNVLLKRLANKENDRKLIDGILQQKHVVVSQSPFTYMVIVCILASRHKIDMGNHVMIVTELKNSPTPLAGIVMSQQFYDQNPITARHLSRSIRISVAESYTLPGLQRNHMRQSMNKRKLKNIGDCFKRIGEPKKRTNLFTPTIANLKGLLTASGCLLILAVVSLMMEILRIAVVRRWNRKTKALSNPISGINR